MRHRLVLLPVLLATLVCVSPAHAWTWPQDGPVLQPFVLGGDPYAAGQHRGIDVAGPPGAPVRAPTAGTVSFAGFVPERRPDGDDPDRGRTRRDAAPPGLARRRPRRDRGRGRDRRDACARRRRRPSGSVRADGSTRRGRPAGLPRSARVPAGARTGRGAVRARGGACGRSGGGASRRPAGLDARRGRRAARPACRGRPIPWRRLLRAASRFRLVPSGQPSRLRRPLLGSAARPSRLAQGGALPTVRPSRPGRRSWRRVRPSPLRRQRRPAGRPLTGRTGCRRLRRPTSVAARSAARRPRRIPGRARGNDGRARTRDGSDRPRMAAVARRSGPGPGSGARRAPGRHAGVHAVPEPPEPVRTTAARPGGPERRLARSGPHADSPVAALAPPRPARTTEGAPCRVTPGLARL